jgi:hypothetical protein
VLLFLDAGITFIFTTHYPFYENNAGFWVNGLAAAQPRVAINQDWVLVGVKLS